MPLRRAKLVLSWSIIIFLIAINFSLHIGVAKNLPSINGFDERGVKEFLGLLSYCVIIAIGLLKTGIKLQKNHWLIILMMFLTMHSYIALPSHISIMGYDFGGAWQFKPLVNIWLAFITASVIGTSEIDTSLIMNVLMWVGLVLAIYAIAQYFKIDPWQDIIKSDEALTTTNGHISTTLTHPNFSSVFIASLLPIALFLRKWWIAAAMIISVIIIKSLFGLATLLACTWLWSHNRTSKGFKTVVYLIAISIVAFVIKLFIDYPAMFSNIDSGRFGVWQSVIYNTVHPTISKESVTLIGYGLGSFHFIFQTFYKLPLLNAHNEFIEMFASVGIIGVVLLLCAIWWMVSKAWAIKDEECRTWIIVFIGLMFGSCGLYIWQVQPHQFLIVLAVGILHGKISNLTNSS